jgi:hypothetical protein
MGTINDSLNLFGIQELKGKSLSSPSRLGEEGERIEEIISMFAASMPDGNTKNAIKGVGDTMDENKVLELYINKIESDTKDLKSDVRSIEKRMDERLNRIEDMIMNQNDKFETKIDKIGDKIDQKFILLNDKVDKVKDDISENNEEQRKFWIGITVSILIGIGGIITAFIK